MHNAFLNINNKKMSKSLGNFFTVREISEKYDLNILRFFMLSAHYRNPLNFSEDLMESAKNSIERIKNAKERITELKLLKKDEKLNKDSITPKVKAKYDEIKNDFENSMDDDFNTADAITAIFKLVSFLNTSLTNASLYKDIEEGEKLLSTLSDILGIKIDRKKEILDSDVEKMINERNKARANKDFKKADEIRDSLKDMGIILEDTKEGVKWKRS